MLTHSEYVGDVIRESQEHMSHGGVIGAYEAAEERAEDFAPVEFVAEHLEEHLVIEGLALGLTALSEAALHGGLASAAFALEEVAVGFEVVGAVLSSPIVLGLSALHTANRFRIHFREKDERARSFSVGLVSKSDCIMSKVTLHHDDILSPQNDLFIPEYTAVCGRDMESRLAEQMVKTNTALLDMFAEFKDMGKCFFPEGPRSWSKSNCVHAIYEPLRAYEGDIGILYSAFAFAAAYGHESDELFSKPVYAEWFERYFDITMPQTDNTRTELNRVAGAPAQAKVTTCLTIEATHRAFERLFVRIKSALKIYAHTFARARLHVSLRTIQHPCRRVFRAWDQRAEGMCKEGEDLPRQVPDTEWIQEHAHHMTDSILDDVGDCLEDTHPELRGALSLSNSGPEEGENEEEENSRHDEE